MQTALTYHGKQGAVNLRHANGRVVLDFFDRLEIQLARVASLALLTSVVSKLRYGALSIYSLMLNS